MTRDEAVAQIQFDLGRRTDLVNEIVAKLQETQRLLEMGMSLPWFLKEEDASLILPVGSADVTFPTGFIREVADEAFHYASPTTGRAIYLEKVDFRLGSTAFATATPGRPGAYAIRRAGWKFFPARDIAYTLTYSFMKQAADLSTNVANNVWLVHQPSILIGKAGMEIAKVLQHKEATQKFADLFTAGWKAAFAETVLREEENAPRSMGGRT